MSKNELRKQIENIEGLNEGDLIGESVRRVLNDIDDGSIVIYWECLPDDILNDTF